MLFKFLIKHNDFIDRVIIISNSIKDEKSLEKLYEYAKTNNLLVEFSMSLLINSTYQDFVYDFLKGHSELKFNKSYFYLFNDNIDLERILCKIRYFDETYIPDKSYKPLTCFIRKNIIRNISMIDNEKFRELNDYVLKVNNMYSIIYVVSVMLSQEYNEFVNKNEDNFYRRIDLIKNIYAIINDEDYDSSIILLKDYIKLKRETGIKGLTDKELDSLVDFICSSTIVNEKELIELFNMFDGNMERLFFKHIMKNDNEELFKIYRKVFTFDKSMKLRYTL